MLQEGGLTNEKCYKRGVLIEEGGLTHYTTKQSVSFEELTKGYNSVSVWGLKLK